MAYKNRLGGHTNSYHPYSIEEALTGIAAAGFKYVELSAVRGWAEHVPLEADGKTLGHIQRLINQLGLRAGDVVTSVNGAPVDSLARGQQIFESLRTAASVRVTIDVDPYSFL